MTDETPPGGDPWSHEEGLAFAKGAVPTSTSSSQSYPAGLGPAGQALWDAVTSEYDLRVDEKALLAEMAWATQEVAALREAIAEQGFTVEGSQGQPRPNPLLATLNVTRTTMIRLAGQLGLPDEGEDPSKASAASRKASHAAKVRWGLHAQREADAEAYRTGRT